MYIVVDSTESRNGTRCPRAITDQAFELPSLEQITGADILLTTQGVSQRLETMKLNLETVNAILAHDQGYHSPGDIATLLEIPTIDVVSVLGLVSAIRSGILVQRKSGSDFLSSIPDLRDIRHRMLRWTWRSWLLVTGKFDVANGNVTVNGRETGWNPASVHGAIRSWRMDGGQVDVLDSDDDIVFWVQEMMDALSASVAKGDDDGRVIRYKQEYERDDDRSRALAILATLKGIGNNGAAKLLDYYGDLAASIEAVLDPTIPGSDRRPNGVLGRATVNGNRELFGLDDGVSLVRVLG